MNDKVRLEMIADSYIRFFRTRDIEHLRDVERILEYDGLAEFEERLETRHEWQTIENIII